MYKKVNIQKKKAPGTLVAGGFLWGEGLNKRFSRGREWKKENIRFQDYGTKKYATADVTVAYEFHTVWFEKF